MNIPELEEEPHVNTNYGAADTRHHLSKPICQRPVDNSDRSTWAPSPLRNIRNDYFPMGALATLMLNTLCPLCAVIAEGVMHFATMLVGKQHVVPDRTTVLCNTPEEMESGPRLVYNPRTRSFDAPAPTKDDFPSEFDVGFIFDDWPEMGMVELEALSSPSAPPATWKASAMEEIRTQLAKCSKEHGEVCGARAFDFMPARLLAISEDHIRLIEPTSVWLETSERSTQRYLALTHCWGNGMSVMKTTKASMHELCAGICIEKLPRSFRDAVHITKDLGHSLLWIDSLCIVQDDDEDWQRESACMADIYRNAILTLSATSAHDSTGGCFPHDDDATYLWRKYLKAGLTPSPSPLYQTAHPWHNSPKPSPSPAPSPHQNAPIAVHHPRLHHTHHTTHTTLHRHFALRPAYNTSNLLSHPGAYAHPGPDQPALIHTAHPVLARAWCFQERLLSPRVVHFGQRELMWECRSAFAARPFGPGATATQGGGQDLRRIPPVASTRRRFTAFLAGGTAAEAAAELWPLLVQDYTRLALTRESDRLPALSGIAAAFAERSGDESKDMPPRYLAGIWAAQLPQALYWKCDGDGARRPAGGYRAPTFSWAAVEGPVDYYAAVKGSLAGPADTVVVCKVRGAAAAGGLNPYGRVTDGYVDVLGWVGRATVAEIRHDRIAKRADSEEGRRVVCDIGRVREEGVGTVCVLEQGGGEAGDVHGSSGEAPARRRQEFVPDIPLRLCAVPAAEVAPGDEIRVLLLECWKRRNAFHGRPPIEGIEYLDTLGYDSRVMVLRRSERVSGAWERVGLLLLRKPLVLSAEVEGAQDMRMCPNPWFQEKAVVRVV